MGSIIWYTPAEPGTFVCIDVQGDSLYLTINCYNQAGDPVWYTSLATESDRNSFTGVLSQWTGWPLGERHQEPKEIEVGTVSLSILNANQAKITMRAGEFPKDKFIEKYMPRVTRKLTSPNRINGWWYDPVDWGMGFFFEVLDDHFLMIWNHYDQNRAPRWWISGGGESFFDSKSGLYTGLVQEWFGGQTITGHYRTHQIH